jgi:heat shock protein HslJ
MRPALAVILLGLTACAAAVSLSAPEAISLPPGAVAATTAPTREQAANATYTGITGEAVTLRDGSWEGPAMAPGAPMHPEVTLARDLFLTGKVGGRSEDVAVVLLAYTTGGSGEEMYLAVVGETDGMARSLGTADLGHNVKVREGRIAGGRIVLDVLQPGPNDAMCCPGELATRTFALSPAGLKEASTTVTGRLAMAAINGSAWVLKRLGHEPAPPRPEVTLAVKDGGISGSAGCNQYGASLTEGGQPGEIRVGPIRATRKACPQEVMALESRYLAALETVVRFTLESSELVLTTSGDAGSLRFGPAPDRQSSSTRPAALAFPATRISS